MSILHHSITINPIQTHKQTIDFDGQKSAWLLDYPPEPSQPVMFRYSDGRPVPPYHFLGQPQYTSLDIIIDPDPKCPAISFPGVYKQGVSVDMVYSYASGYNFGLVAPPDENAIQVPATFTDEIDQEDYRIIKQAMIDGRDLDFSQCMWIMSNKEKFPESEGDEWEAYAVEHNERFRKERPR